MDLENLFETAPFFVLFKSCVQKLLSQTKIPFQSNSATNKNRNFRSTGFVLTVG